MSEAAAEPIPLPEDPSEAAAARPSVSVVLICFNDAGRLPDAIASAQAQTLTDIEILIVDHGSTDGSVEVARAAAEADPRIRVIDLGDNEGKPGRPINAGIRAATAPWVTVFASDDILRPRACERMLRAATEYGADIVVGSLLRVNMDTGETTRWMPGVTLRSRVLTSITQLPELIRDTTGGGKLYNTEFVRAHGLSFPEDIYYQDQVFTLEYYAAADTVAILSDFVLEWRHWPSGQSVTQRRTTLENLTDRFAANERIDEFLRREHRDDLLILKQRKFLTHDLSIHVKDLAGTTAEYRDALVNRTKDALAGFLPESFTGLPLNKYLMVNCLRAGRVEDAEQVTVTPYNRITATWPRVVSGGRTYVAPPWRTPAADPVFDVSDYRLNEIPDRFRAVRGALRVEATKRGFDATFTLVGNDRAGAVKDVHLVLQDVVRGNQLRVPLRRERGGATPDRCAFRGKWRLGELDHVFTVRPEDLDFVMVLDPGTPQQASLIPHAADEQPETEGLTGHAWQVHNSDDTLRLVRDDTPPTPSRVPGRPRPTEPSDNTAVLSVLDAKQYLRESDIEPDPQRVFFESFAGRRVGDGPLVLSRALQLRNRKAQQSWSCTAWAQLDVPTYASALPRFSVKYLDALAGSAVWVDNGWLPFRPRRNRTLINLRQGVPLVRLPEAEKQPLWSAVVTSGPFDEEQLTAALPKPMTYWREGAPRTDPLLSAEHTARRRQLRETWGLQDRTVVLYCPVLREGEVSPEARTPDLYRMADELGPDYFWLYREHDDDSHGRRAASIPDDLRWFAATTSQRVDVSDYLLMADVLVSDYTTLIPDFGWTGRPVIHYVPDQTALEHGPPGTTIRLEERSAGPVVHDDGALLKALREANAADARSRRFAESLAPADGVLSAGAVLDRLGF